MRIDAELLYRLSVVIEERSFTRAAARLCMSQPSLTACIAQLESRLDVKLLERGRHGAVPTVYGERLYERARVIHSELERAGKDIDELRHGTQGTLTIGAISGPGVKVVCPAIARLLELRPGVQVEFVEEAWERDLMRKLRRREIDVAICPMFSHSPEEALNMQPVFRTRRVVATRRDHPATLGRKFNLARLSSSRLVVPRTDIDLRLQHAEIFAALSLPFPTRTVVAGSLSAALELVSCSDFFMITTQLSVAGEVERGTLSAFEIGVPTDFWYYAFLAEAGAPKPLTAAFLQELRGVCLEKGMQTAPVA